MSSIVQLKRSALTGKVPGTGSLNLGELALNTYDGKIFFRRSGSTDTIQEVVTTNVLNTGSVTITGTLTAGSIVGSITASNGVVSGSSQIVGILSSLNSYTASYATTGSNQFTADQNITGSLRATLTGSFGSLKVNDTLTINHGETIISGSALVTSDLTILGAVNARQFNISVISSSVLFQSGSTRFGNTSDDTHDFTGSINVTGSLYLNGIDLSQGNNSGSFSGSFQGDGSGLRGVVSDDIPRDGWDYNVNSSASISDFNSESDKYYIDFAQSQSTEVGTPVGYKGFLTNVSGSTQILPTLDGIDFVVGNNVVASIGVGGIIAQATAGTVSGSSQLTASVLATTGSNTFRGTQTMSGSIIPAIDNTYDLGSATYQWRDIYVSSGSLYIDGTKVLGSTGNELQITTDVGQSIKILEAGSDSIILQSADGNIELKSSGGGNLLFDPTTGLIDVRGTLQIQDGNKITSSGGNGIVFGNNIVVSGSIESTGNINGINLSTFSSSIASTFLNQNTATSSYETKGRGIVSGSSQLTSSALATTGSNSFVGNQSISGTIYLTGSIIPSGSFVYDLGSETNSFRDLFLSTGSIRFHNPDGTEQGRITVDASSGDISLLKTAGLTNIEKATISQGNINPNFLSAVSASSLFVQNKIVLPINGTVHGINLTVFSASVSSTIINQNSATSSYETKGRGLVSGSSQITYTNISSIPSGIVSGSSQITLSSTTGFSTYSTSVDSRITTEKGRVDAILLAADADKDSFAEIVTLINSVDTSNDSTFASFYTASVNRLNNLETTSGSVNISISNINTQTGSSNTRLTALETSASTALSTNGTQATSITNLNTTTASLNTSVTNINTTTASLNTSVTNLNSTTASLNTSVSNLNTATSSYETKGRSIVSGSSQITFSGISSLPTLVSGSSQVTLSSTTGYGSVLNQAVLTTSTPTFAGITANGHIYATNGSISFGGTSSPPTTDPAIYRVAGNDLVVAIGSSERVRIASTGTSTFSGNVEFANGYKIRMQNPSMMIDALTPSYFGYSSGYGTLIVGHTGNNNRSIAFGVDVSANASGAFTGLGNEYIWRGAASFITPNSSNNGYNTLFSWNSSGQMTFNQNATFSGTITENSSLRYKENVETIKYGLDKVLQMRGVTYNKKDNGVKELGVIAEEIYDVLPEVVLKNEEGEIDSVSYGRITAVLIEAIKDLKKEIEELKANR